MARSTHRVNLRDIAEASGVSIQTVSRVVRGVDVVAGPTRERVMEAVRRLNYRPNLAARSLSAHRTGSVHVIVAVPLFHGHASTFVAICQQLAALELHTSTTVVPQGLDEPPDVRDLVPVSADGVILIGGHTDPSPWVETIAFRTPTVIVGRLHCLPEGAGGIAVDHKAGAIMAVRHLVERGARRIVHVAGPQDWMDAHLRLEGYRQVCAEAGLESFVLHAESWDAPSAAQLMGEIPADTDAVFAANDQLALGCMSALQRRGVSIPDDIKVVGFDDMRGADSLFPTLTTVRQDFQRIGELAVLGLNKLLGAAEPELCALQPTLIVREST